MRLRHLHEHRNFEMWQIMHKRNLRANYDDTVLAMSEVEGTSLYGKYNDQAASGWLESQEDTSNRYTASYARRRIEEIMQIEIGGGEEINGGLHVSTIYGNGGFNRWHVYLNGLVMFSAGHGSEAATKKARELGFEIKQ